MATADIDPDLLAAAREICLELPEAVEKETWGHPTFRVRDKIFAGIGVGADAWVPDADDTDAQPVELTTMTMKAAPGEQESLLAVGRPFYRPKYVGNRGWIGIVIDATTDWGEVEELIIDSYRTIAPKKLVRVLDEA